MAQNKKFSIIIPLYKDNYKTLDYCLHCIEEQDYKNHEVLLVHNSPTEKGKTFLHSKKDPLKDYKGVWKELDAGYNQDLGTGNHCRAFNYGASVATGDYLIFLDPDSYLLPGVLREYKDAFESHPEASFVYGDYDFTEGVGRVEGRPYSEYELKCANYVSGSFPIKKSAFKGWDPEVKSLQDWDMWLSAVDTGAKGYYLQRPCFITHPPVITGISAAGAKSWLKTFSFVRNKHNFPIPSTVVTSGGAPLHATKVAEALAADSRVRNTIHNFKEHTYKNIYLLGFYPTVWKEHLQMFYDYGDLAGTVSGEKRIIHWIGTDIYQMQHKLSFVAWKNIVTFLNDPLFSFIHLVEYEKAQEELRELGIESEVVPLPIPYELTISPLPKKFTVGVYINPTQDMYYEEFMYHIASVIPEVDFKFFGDPNQKKVDKNMEWVGFVDMQMFLPTISALVRLTIHDGKPVSPIESMQAGRNVICNTPLKHAILHPYKDGQPDEEVLIKQINELKEAPLNKEGSEYWQEEASAKKFRERMSKYLV